MTQQRWLEVLSSAECHARLATGKLGRVALSIGALPVILPVLYLSHDGSIWFFAEEGTKLNAAVINAVVAFEVDHLDDTGGWSVLVIGQCNEELDPDVVSSVRSAGLVAGAPGLRDHLVRIPVHHISGRSFSVSHRSAGDAGYA